MFDTMTLTKTLGAFCGALLIFLLGNLAAESLYHVGGEHSEEGGPAYVLLAEGEGEGEAQEEVAHEGPSFEEVFAVADAGAGEKMFKQCAACHKLNGVDGTGPHLNGVVGRAVGSVAGYGYSAVLADHGGAWEPEELNAFLTKPKEYAPGTKMGYAGMKKIEDRANLIAYLQTQQ